MMQKVRRNHLMFQSLKREGRYLADISYRLTMPSGLFQSLKREGRSLAGPKYPAKT